MRTQVFTSFETNLEAFIIALTILDSSINGPLPALEVLLYPRL